ncbi:hypothetical protein F511_01097 [Dorcoceras hygrometricum]|uniref:Uncharacterized protein n=1 Tax=Dorcoceras hygrometricum TaxID=472368 RepID=A0A2Z7AG25_9LAMI|nr:hypothetical protein F511_01097 [Dorcoceras hygrometricum]
MRLVQIKRLGPGKFYIANWCVSGNPSSHKGWMSRYFFVKRISSWENPWGCDMSWRDEARAQPPQTPDRAPDLTEFLRVTREKCFNAQELIEEDLLCYFKFSGKKVPLVGDLGERMSKAEMLRALREKKADPEGASRSLSKGKRKITEEGGEKPKKRHHEKKTRESDRDKVSGETTKETPSSGGQNPEQQTNETSYEYLDASNISFVAKPSGSVSLDFTRRLISDQDYDLVNSVPDLAALEAASLNFMQALVWSGSVANRLIRVREEVTKTKHSMDEMLDNHEGLMKQLAEIRANNDKEKEVMVASAELGLSVPSWSGLCTHVEELREEKSYARRCQCETGLKCAELVGLMHSRRRATRGGASAKLGLSVPSWSGLCTHVEELREEVPVRNWA